MCFKPRNRWIRDDFINCFKEKLPGKAGREILKSQLSVLSEKYVAMAGPEFLMVDSDNEKDKEIEIL